MYLEYIYNTCKLRGSEKNVKRKSIMQLTRHTDYALRVLMYLAAKPKETISVVELAEFYNISRNHLVKVVQGLVMHKFVITTRGKSGGMQLASDSSQISIGAVVRKMENHFNLVECFDSGQSGCVLDGSCYLKSIIASAAEEFLQKLDDVSLKEVTKPKLRGLIVSLQ